MPRSGLYAAAPDLQREFSQRESLYQFAPHPPQKVGCAHLRLTSCYSALRASGCASSPSSCELSERKGADSEPRPGKEAAQWLPREKVQRRGRGSLSGRRAGSSAKVAAALPGEVSGLLQSLSR